MANTPFLSLNTLTNDLLTTAWSVVIVDPSGIADRRITFAEIDKRYQPIINAASGNKVFATPADGSSGALAARALVSSDLPTIGSTKGGTGLTAYNQGDLLYASAANTLATAGGNSAAGRKFLEQSGSGTLPGPPAWSNVFDSDLSLSDILTGNASTSHHGFLIKLSGSTGQFLNGNGAWSTPSSAGTPGGSDTNVQVNSLGTFAGYSTLAFSSSSGTLTATNFSGGGASLTGLTKSQVGLSNVENTALSTWAGSTNLVTLGTVNVGTWSATAIAVASGGTGATSAGGARTNLGLAIGSNVEAWSANLDSWSAISPPVGSVVGTSDTQTLTNKTINASSNTISNLTTSMFASNVVDTDGTLSANSDTRLASQKAVKSYVDAAITGLKWKTAVRAATTTNGTLITAYANGQVIDGITLSTGDRILIKNQTTGSDNGIYTVNLAGAPTRSTDADTGTELVAATVYVEDGTTLAGTGWNCTNDSITLGTTSIVFVQFSGSGTYTAGFALTLTGNSFAVTDAELVALAGLTSAADSLPYFTGSGTAATTSFPSFGRSLVGSSSAGATKTLLSLNNVENTALSTWTGNTSIASVGTITVGVWGATTIGVGHGGTGLTSATLGDILYSSASNTFAKLAGNTSAGRQFLSQTGTGSASAAPIWIQPADSDLSLTDITTNNASTSNHGFLLKLSGTVNQFLNGSGAWATGREVLTGNRTYFVRTDGSDSNNGSANTSGAAFLTIQKAIDTSVALDLSTFAVTISVADGTYTGANTLKSYLGVGPITIQGNTGTPGNVIISTTSADCFFASSVLGAWVLNGMQVQTTTSGSCLHLLNGSIVTFTNFIFGACAAGNAHLQVTDYAAAIIGGAYTISGGAGNHFALNRFAKVARGTGGSITVTVSGTPTFSTFASLSAISLVQVNLITWSGSATGTRYSVSGNSVLDTAGAGSTALPGSVGGSTASGGQYL